MDDLLKSQIHENCKLALPGGLKDLMSDISREVLRAQPQNLYQFIANYLGALLEARETLTIACQVCSDICKCSCVPIKPELYHELMKIGLDEEDVENAIEVVEKHFKSNQKENEPIKEQSLLLKLLRKTSINETQVPAIQQAIQKAFKRHSLGQEDPMVSNSISYTYLLLLAFARKWPL
ncbi:sperm surface protein Sp17-like [Maniola hyperantus]|uniref:sperm surface protein Sp17-like n=1 Tax=Aphantopus hyperantus TaxID=2795564 RepID=UPI0037491F12